MLTLPLFGGSCDFNTNYDLLAFNWDYINRIPKKAIDHDFLTCNRKTGNFNRKPEGASSNPARVNPSFSVDIYSSVRKSRTDFQFMFLWGWFWNSNSCGILFSILKLYRKLRTLTINELPCVLVRIHATYVLLIQQSWYVCIYIINIITYIWNDLQLGNLKLNSFLLKLI